MMIVANLIAGGAAVVAAIGLRRVWPPHALRRLMAVVSLIAAIGAASLVWFSGTIMPTHERPAIFDDGVLFEEASTEVDCEDKAVLQGLGIIAFGVALTAAAVGRGMRGRGPATKGVGPLVAIALVLAGAAWIVLLAPLGGCGES